MEMVLHQVLVLVQHVPEPQHVLVQDQPQEAGVAFLKYCRRPNNWSTMKMELSHNLIGNAGGVALRTLLLDSELFEHEHVRTWSSL